jgi:hypothetical protein
MPFGLYSPEMLAQMAQSAFKPPQPMGMPGMQQQRQQTPGFNIGGAIGALGAGLDGWKPGGVTGKDEQGAVGPGGLSGAVSGIGGLKPDANGVWQQPPMPTDIGYGQGGGGNAGGPLSMQDFWSGKWLPSLGFTPPGGGFTGGGSSGWGG